MERMIYNNFVFKIGICPAFQKKSGNGRPAVVAAAQVTRPSGVALQKGLGAPLSVHPALKIGTGRRCRVQPALLTAKTAFIQF